MSGILYDFDTIRQQMHDTYSREEEAAAIVPVAKQIFKDSGWDQLYDIDTIVVVPRGEGYGVTFPRAKG